MDDQNQQTQNNPAPAQDLQIPNEIRGFIENLLNDSGMTYTDDDMKEEMVKEIFVRLDQYIASVIVSSLPADKVEDFIKMNEDRKPQAEIEAYIKEHIPNTKDVFAKAFGDFRNMYLGATTQENK